MIYAKFAAVLLGTTALIPISAMAQTNNQAPQPGAQGRAAAGPAAQAQAGQQGLPAGQLQNQPLYTQAGQEFGRVHSVVRDQQGRTFLVVLHGEGHYLVPGEQLRYANNRFVLAGMTGQERLQPYTPPVAANHETLGADQRIAVAGYGAQTQQAEASRLLIQQRAPAVQFQQAAPQITVRQPEPSVTVAQPQPEILVQQPPPTIRVELPQPQITVRMPQPDVNVAMAPPQVQVRQPQPQVQVQRAQGEAQVQVQREQPQVQVQRAQGEPQVQVQQGQPVVRYERTGEPKVIYNQAPGQPVVRIERAAQEPEAQAQTGSTTQAAAQRQGMTE
ncbi:MAG TPA: hypothetical protein VGW38_09835, partial [Chloroflexota bacterium]|nr:hypothetical protein [Chloroflexota bacterium]